MRRLLTLAAAFAALAGAASAVELRANPTDDDGRITLAELFDGTDSQAVVGTRSGASAVLDAVRLQQLARAQGVVWANSSGLQRIIVRQGAPASAPAMIRAGAARPAAGSTVDALTYARNIAAGELIQPTDIVFAPVQAHLAPADAPSDPDMAVGQSARRALRAGAAVSARDLTAPRVIRRGEIIQVAFEQGAVALTVQARALGDAAPGQMLQVVNTTSNRTLQATATGPGRAVVGPPSAHAPQQFAALR
ncbi:MAG TPA: flagellar basal body P-ring formation chaperone FlgA [Caulobacteraceae bacterium]